MNLTLLEEAKLKYPVGTKYICPSSNLEHIVSSQKFSEPWTNTIFGDLGEGCLFCEGTWAEIISLPKRKTAKYSR